MSLQHSTDRCEAKGEARESTEQEVIVVPLELGHYVFSSKTFRGMEVSELR